MSKILIVGLGSIGQRHARALFTLGEKNIAALRTQKGQKDIDPDLQVVKMFYGDKEALEWEPTHIIISNPTSLHIRYVKWAIENKLKFFVEKPVFNDMTEIEAINGLNPISGVVGFNLRYHSLFQKLKEILVSEKYGRIITAKLHVGQYLPNWHSYEDYRNAYYAKKNLGGGALRTLSHELDLMQFFFGKINKVLAKVERLSKLEIDVDDVVNIIAQANNCRQINLHINFLDPLVKREGYIYCSNGVIHYDLIQSIIVFTSNHGVSETIFFDKEDYNMQYVAQMKDFLSDNISGYGCSFIEGLEVQRIIEACLKSNLEKKEICLD